MISLPFYYFVFDIIFKFVDNNWIVNLFFCQIKTYIYYISIFILYNSVAKWKTNGLKICKTFAAGYLIFTQHKNWEKYVTSFGFIQSFFGPSVFTFCFWPIKTWVDFTINKYSQLFKVNFPHFVLRKSSDTVLTWIFSLKHLIKILILFISWFGLQLLYHLPVDSRRLRVQTCIVQKPCGDQSC